MLSVADTGTGNERGGPQSRLRAFYTTKEIGKGTGLGLSMVYAFAKQSGGAVTIDSETGRGTVVRLYLPRAQRPLDAVDEDGAQKQPHSGPPARILVVDDDDDVRSVTRTLLTTLGHETSEAATGPEALCLLRQDRNFDLLMIDLLMPKMDARRLPQKRDALRSGRAGTLHHRLQWTSDAQKISEAQYLIKKPFRLQNWPSNCGTILRQHRWVRQSGTRRSRSALPTTVTELTLIAALAIIGLSSSPKKG